jgi:hypothetical protein
MTLLRFIGITTAGMRTSTIDVAVIIVLTNGHGTGSLRMAGSVGGTAWN